MAGSIVPLRVLEDRAGPHVEFQDRYIVFKPVGEFILRGENLERSSKIALAEYGGHNHWPTWRER